ncbi:SIR2 family NAD-dependent protein deacylase, partial [Nocardia farcinica]|uniref:SIR2 family NAD-dependent protein deacylase n=1 Tax=Nocardia farcinica TaxID=37329 RepID=UPI0024569D4A
RTATRRGSRWRSRRPDGTRSNVTSLPLDSGAGTAPAPHRVRPPGPPRAGGGPPDPACPECGGILKAATIMFGQQLDQRTMTKAALTAQTSDIFLAIGTSLQVEPAASMCALAVDAGADLVIVNAEPTPYDSIATEVVHEPIGTALPRLVKEILDA